jgi:DNA-binding MarR family transcriptional regulator
MSKSASSIPIPAVGEGKRGEQGHIGYLLRQAQAAHRQRMERALAGLAITLPQFSVLTMLDAYPGASGADLARLSLLTAPTMSVIVANLERSGAVTRRPHAVHGRIQQIEVTEAGRKLLARCRACVKPVEAELLGGLSTAEQAAVRRWLVKVALPPDAG